jgi:uncharacterized protein
MKTLRRTLVLIAVVAIFVYGGAIAWLIAHETTIVFQPGQPLGDLRPRMPFEQIAIEPPGAPRQIAWMIRTDGGSAPHPWVIYLHGNRLNIASRLNILHYERLSRLGVNVLAPEYRGFGGMDGVPTESGVGADARSAYDYLRQQLHADPRRIVIYGWSLGSAIAVNLAADVEEAAVVLEGAPASIVAIGEQNLPYFPVGLIVRNRFESIRRIRQIRAPLLFLHSPTDTIVPIAEGRRLFDAAPQPKQFVEVAGGHVFASENDPNFFPAIRSFLQSHQLLE